MLVVNWLVSTPGIVLQALLALIFQLAGVVLVVKDVREARRRLERLNQRFIEIDNDTKLAIKIADREGFDEDGKPRPDASFSTLYSVPFMTLQELINGLHQKSRALADQHDHHRGPAAWVGPATLLLGIVFSFTATVSAM